MKANDFVKKHGWVAVVDAVKSTNAEETAFFESTNLDPIISGNGETIGFDVKVYRIKYDEVKRLVESHELVGNFGGLKRSKRILKKAYTSFNILITGICNDKPFQCTVEQLQDAIADMESCQ